MERDMVFLHHRLDTDIICPGLLPGLCRSANGRRNLHLPANLSAEGMFIISESPMRNNKPVSGRRTLQSAVDSVFHFAYTTLE